jgi:hypothetical protein
MKKWMITAGIAVTFVAAGGSAAYLQNRGSDAGPVTAPAPITAVAGVSSSPGQAGSGGCSCCSGPASASSPATGRTEQIEAYLTDFYTRILGEDVSVMVEDFGCHHEASILQGGKVVKRLSIRGNSVTDIT